jgi:carbon-monoxide dehydrogenase iron sulfur subunit
MRKKLIDKSKCAGCKNCELACITAHSKSPFPFITSGTDEIIQARNKIELDAEGKLFPEFCRHCDEPSCVEACISGALIKGEDGLVVCNQEICIGCFMCVMSCPYGMARPGIKNGRCMVKCDGCHGRESMACVDACPQRCLSQVDTEDELNGQVIYV